MSDARDEIINLFEIEIFPYKDNTFKTKEESKESKFFKNIENESKSINLDLFKIHFDVVAPTVLAKKLYETKDKKKNNELVELIKVKWSDLKDEIKKMSIEEIEDEKPDKIPKIVEEIIIFNNENKKQQGLGLKILTPDQMLNRLPITLAQ